MFQHGIIKSQLNSLQPYLAEKVPWNSHGYYLNARPSFTIDPLFHAGAYYVQEASSMFLEVALRQSCELNSPLRVLDLCAAPGGKSTLIQSLLSPESLLVSNEVIKSRANILAENLTKWGAANVIVTNNDPKDFKRLPSFFDCIVVDAPCSGSGLFRKDADAVAEWSLNNVALCSQRQQRILADVMNALKPGGILVYSTCSYSTDEDEFISDWLADNHAVQSLRLQLREDWNIVETTSEKHNNFGYRFYPDKLKGEGFFIAVFKKQGEISVPRADKRNLAKNTTPSRLEEAIAAPYIVAPTLVTIMKWQSDLLAIPKVAYDSVLQLQQNMYIKKAGVNFGTV
ncbi:MAG: RsmB/NOP family class I SAM-dependent RNA methyltransferase, partial [Chitinophagaceae bacterium]